MNIYLTGGGDQANFRQLDLHFMEHIPLSSKLLVIPQACDEEDYEHIQQRIEETFFHKKVQSVELLENPHSISLEELNEFDAIIIEGGNTFQLIKAIRESSLFNHLSTFAKNKNKFIYADSAGAILLGTDTQSAFLGEDGDEDHHKLQDYRGLNILEPWIVHAHFETDDAQALEDLMYATGSPIIALREESGIVINSKGMLSLGPKAAHLFTFSGIETLDNGETLRFDV